MAELVPLGHLVGIDLVAAVQHQSEGPALVFAPQPFPHGVPLGPFTVHVPHFLAVAGNVRQTQIAGQVTGDRVGGAIPAVFRRAVGREREPRAPDAGIGIASQQFDARLARCGYDRRRRIVSRRDEQCGQQQLAACDIVEEKNGADGRCYPKGHSRMRRALVDKLQPTAHGGVTPLRRSRTGTPYRRRRRRA